MAGRPPPAPFGVGDRVLHVGVGPRKQADVLAVRGRLAVIRFDAGWAAWALVRDCLPVPRRPPPMW